MGSIPAGNSYSVMKDIIYCGIFTLMVKLSVRGGAINALYFYPKAVQDKAIEIGLTDRDTMNRKRKHFMISFYDFLLYCHASVSYNYHTCMEWCDRL